MACADTFVREKGGLDIPVIEGGKNFSGGQRQRLTIARAVAAKPDILILDDSCSALDFATDAALRANIAALSGMTCILISQRASSIRSADAIFVLEDGKVVGQGTHEALYGGCPLYREICDSQARGGRMSKAAVKKTRPKGAKKGVAKRLLACVRPYKGYAAGAFVCSILYVAFTLIGPVLYGFAIDDMLGEGQVLFRSVFS